LPPVVHEADQGYRATTDLGSQVSQSVVRELRGRIERLIESESGQSTTLVRWRSNLHDLKLHRRQGTPSTRT
jgi:hypothetical protein